LIVDNTNVQRDAHALDSLVTGSLALCLRSRGDPAQCGAIVVLVTMINKGDILVGRSLNFLLSEEDVAG